MRGGSEMALRNDYALQDEARTAARWYETLRNPSEAALARIGAADLTFTEPPGGMPTVELGSFFGIDPSSYNLWDATTYDFAGPGPVTPIRNAGTKARAVRLRGMVGVLQDSLHLAGVWPWLDGRKCVSKPWELTMEGLMGSIERMGREGAVSPWPPLRVTAVNRDTRTITVGSDAYTFTPDAVWRQEPVPRKKPRYTPPPTRLDGRRKR